MSHLTLEEARSSFIGSLGSGGGLSSELDVGLDGARRLLIFLNEELRSSLDVKGLMVHGWLTWTVFG